VFGPLGPRRQFGVGSGLCPICQDISRGAGPGRKSLRLGRQRDSDPAPVQITALPARGSAERAGQQVKRDADTMHGKLLGAKRGSVLTGRAARALTSCRWRERQRWITAVRR
jgi:hypothetical protein